VQSITTKKNKHTIAVDVVNALEKTKESNQLCLGGSLLATRKKPHVIDVASNPSIPHSYWSII
jgi:hypothetical protein